jgi:hypothetical protein
MAGFHRLTKVIEDIVPIKAGNVVELTDSTGLSGTHNDTLSATSVMADITGGQDPTEAEFNTLLATVRVMAQNASDIAQKLNELIAALKTANLMHTS